MQFTTNLLLSSLVLATLFLSDFVNGSKNYRHIKRNVVTVVNGPIDRTDTYDGPIPTGITTSFHSSSLTTKTMHNSTSGHNDSNHLGVVVGVPIMVIMGLVLGL